MKSSGRSASSWTMVRIIEIVRKIRIVKVGDIIKERYLHLIVVAVQADIRSEVVLKYLKPRVCKWIK